MSKPFNPLDWYWLKPDGASLFGSKHMAVVAADDTDYKAWIADGSAPTLWPRDEAGQQTDAAMQSVLAPYGLVMPGQTVVPDAVTSAQAKIQCLRTPGAESGKTLLDDITAAVQADGGEVEIWFTEARTWERSNPYVESLSTALKLTAKQVDGLFIAAATIAA
ncbi:hypothetical protein [Methylobacterium sp. B1]|uniref:hypothetical protein n=1 Tax=Methylobacterium sp. B1 TaxID=91459 RepID=UPI00034ADD4A|nr:hypothetical protein [Methylobacterium sp. B1]